MGAHRTNMRNLARLCLGLALFALPVLAQEGELDRAASIREGRALMARGEAARAEELFQRLLDGADDDAEARMWLLRTWMEQGRSNDTLDALDALAREGGDPRVLDYLYGMAFALRGDGLLAAGVMDASVRRNYADAAERLRRALASGDERFRDAWLALARSAWFSQDLPVARRAAEKASDLEPRSGRAWAQLGRVAFSQYVLTQEDEVRRVEAPGHWERARAALTRAVELFRTEGRTGAARRRLAESSLQLGHVYAWEGRRAEAALAYGTAVAEAPSEMNYRQLEARLEPALGDHGEPLPGEGAPGHDYNRALEWGWIGLDARRDATPEEEALLLWWLGLSRYRVERPRQAEEAFLASVERSPSFANAWFYVALIRYDRADHDGAAAAFARGWDTDPSALLAEMKTAPVHVAKVDWLIGRSVAAERYLEAAHLAELCAETVVTEPRHWSNLGLFLRREHERRAEADDVDATEQERLGEKALAAYLRALDLDAEDPQLVNDAAVVLEYVLDRELERALAMYVEAQDLAARHLAAPELSPEDRARFELAREDAHKNQVDLEKKLADRGE